jgi:hypothetical protein
MALYFNKVKLFEEDFTDIVEMLLFPKKKKKEASKNFELYQQITDQEERFAITKGVEEVAILKAAITSFLEKAEDCILAKKITVFLQDFSDNLDNTKRVLEFKFNPVLVVNKSGPEAYQDILRKRTNLIQDLKDKYISPDSDKEENDN